MGRSRGGPPSSLKGVFLRPGWGAAPPLNGSPTRHQACGKGGRLGPRATDGAVSVLSHLCWAGNVRFGRFCAAGWRAGRRRGFGQVESLTCSGLPGLPGLACGPGGQRCLGPEPALVAGGPGQQVCSGHAALAMQLFAFPSPAPRRSGPRAACRASFSGMANHRRHERHACNQWLHFPKSSTLFLTMKAISPSGHGPGLPRL